MEFLITALADVAEEADKRGLDSSAEDLTSLINTISKFADTQTKTAILRKKYREESGKEEWALLDRKGKRVLKWFGSNKPSDESVQKEEQRVQYFKHKDED